jgi:hypothetical protein
VYVCPQIGDTFAADDEADAIANFKEPPRPKNKGASIKSSTHLVSETKAWKVWKVVDNKLPAPYDKQNKLVYNDRNMLHKSTRVSFL